MKNRKKEKILYVNYFPYDNSGKILDYLIENYEYVFLFLAGFYHLGNEGKINKLVIYKNGKILREDPLYQLPLPPKFVFFLLPIKSFITFTQILWNSIKLVKEFGRIDIYFTVNAFTATIGILLKKLKIVKNTVFWVWDYYPWTHEKLIVVIMRKIYWEFDKFATVFSDNTFFLNKNMVPPRKKENVLLKSGKYPIIPIGTGPAKYIKNKNLKNIRIGFIGVLKKSQGLDIIFDNAQILYKNFPNITFDIIGSGPDEQYFKNRAKKALFKTKFHGYVDEDTFEKILIKCTIGIAPYMPEPSSVSYYTDPGKPKRYINFGLPCITTNVIDFSKVLQKNNAGVTIDYYKPQELVNAIKKIIKNYSMYQKNAVELNEKYNYQTIYAPMFKFKK